MHPFLRRKVPSSIKGHSLYAMCIARSLFIRPLHRKAGSEMRRRFNAADAAQFDLDCFFFTDGFIMTLNYTILPASATGQQARC
jgi:hypothetical protein